MASTPLPQVEGVHFPAERSMMCCGWKGSRYYYSLIWLRLKRSSRFSQESNLDLLRGGRGCKRRCCIFNIITGSVNGTPGHLESLWSLSTPRLGRPVTELKFNAELSSYTGWMRPIKFFFFFNWIYEELLFFMNIWTTILQFLWKHLHFFVSIFIQVNRPVHPAERDLIWAGDTWKQINNFPVWDH